MEELTTTPITGKSREFDIRALYQEKDIRVHLSVECKNLQPHFPLVMHCLRRKQNEAYNEWIYTFDADTRYGSDIRSLSHFEQAESIEVSRYSIYPEAAYVAKSADQVGRRNDGSITATDGGVFEKISQAINSSRDLISEAYDLDTKDNDSFTFVCPVLIVPDSTLWRVKYSDDGARDGAPEPINHVSYFIGKEWTVGSKLHSLTYSLSHLEVLTFSELRGFVTQYLWNYVKRCKSAIEIDALS